MAGKPLNKANLLALGADTLADLLLEAVKGDAARQRRVRLALAAGQGPEQVAADLRKRFAAIRRGKSFIARQSQKKLGRELDEMTGLIETQVAPEAPDMAFDLLWALLHLAEPIHNRTDDSWGTIGDSIRGAMAAIGRLAERLTTNPQALAEDVFEAVVADGYGAFDGAVGALSPALGQEGLNALKLLVEAAKAEPLTAADIARYDYISNRSERETRALEGRNHVLEILLQDVADQQGDVDAWLAKYTPEQLAYSTIAPSAASRLLEAGRAEEALALVETALARYDAHWLDPRELDDAHFACLSALGRTEDLRDALWRRFEARLCPDALRHHLKMLPDFEDIEAEDAARRVVLAYKDVDEALAFCLTTQDMALARQVIDARSAEIDGDAYEVLTPLADALVAQYPLQAVLLWRAMIDFALTRQRKGRYGHAARHLAACATADATIADYEGHPDHTTYHADLRERHARKISFWEQVSAQGG